MSLADFLLYSAVLAPSCWLIYCLNFWWCTAYEHEQEAPKIKDFSLKPALNYRMLAVIILLEIVNLLLIKLALLPPLAMWTAFGFGSILVLLSCIDMKHFLLPDALTKPLIALGLTQAFLNIHIDIKQSIIGAAVGYGSLWLVNFLFKVIRNKDGMGMGDFKLFAAIGAWAGWTMLPLTIFLSSLAGILFAVISRGFSGDHTQPYPFGPMLAAAGFVALLFGKDIIKWYLGLLS